jgi:cytochrome c peroxidase
MRGHQFSNLTDREIWDEVFKRVIQIQDYERLFQKAFPHEKWNIGHLGKALAHFQDIEFSTRETGWDSYLKGNTKALSLEEKKGALIFNSKARCSICHNGRHLTNFGFENILVPHLSFNENFMDRGRGTIDKRRGSAFTFIVSPLRNVGLTAPYFHNGSMATLEGVIEHYNEPIQSLQNYSANKINETFGNNYKKPFISKYSEEANQLLFRNSSRRLPLKLALKEDEKKNLVLFLRRSLTEKRFIHLIP